MEQGVSERASDRAYRVLREEILDFSLNPGEVIGEVGTAARLGVSRTPLREALSRLLADGLLVPEGARGVAVALLSAADIIHLTELREALETQAARLASRRLAAHSPDLHSTDPHSTDLRSSDPHNDAARVFGDLAAEFTRLAANLPSEAGAAHDREATYRLAGRLDSAIDEAAASPDLAAALSQVRLRLARVRRLAQDNPERLAQAALEHRAIAEAVAWRDPELAVHAVRVHLRRSLNHALAQLTTEKAHK